MTLPNADAVATPPDTDRGGVDTPAAAARTPDHPGDRRLDLRGLHCPMPVLRTRKALRQVTIGMGIVLDCTDPLTAIDIPQFVAEAGHDLVESRRDGDLFTYRIVRRR